MNRKIVLFGEPLSGKSTIAQEFYKVNKDFQLIEASKDIIYLVGNSFKKYPDNYEKFISTLIKIKKDKAPLNREYSRKIFKILTQKYSKNIISKIIEDLFVNQNLGGKYIFAGVRGIENAKYLKDNGYLIIYLHAQKKDLINRYEKIRGYTKKEALDELKEENKIYSTTKIKKIANFVFDTSFLSKKEIVKKINFEYKKVQECKKCINTNENPLIKFNNKGYCKICETYLKNFSKKNLKKELKFLKKFIRHQNNKHDIMVGISGGKDSSAMLYQIKKMGFNPLAFTFNNGYLHKYISKRAKKITENVNVNYELISVKKHASKNILNRFEQLNNLYKKNNKNEISYDYFQKRINYAGVSRPCWVCRELMIHSYYNEAVKRGIKIVALGINEWTSLKKTNSRGEFNISAIRKLKPFKDKPAVYIIHFPFLVQSKLKDIKKILKKINWNYYNNVQSNAYSCLLANSVEKTLAESIGFHPDTTRLAREVTVGFLTKKEAKKALKNKSLPYNSLKNVLKDSGLINTKKN